MDWTSLLHTPTCAGIGLLGGPRGSYRRVTLTRLQFLLLWLGASCMVGQDRLDLSIHLFAYEMWMEQN